MRRARSPYVMIAAALVLTSAAASAQEECPLGSVQKTESGQTWCEPTVCDTDTNCPTGSVCRPVALCVEIGVLDNTPAAKAEAGTKLLVRQRCGAEKSCPQKTTCSDKSRCITRAQAEKAGLLTPPGASSSAAPASGSAADPPKKTCGCHTPGTRGGETAGLALAVLGACVIVARRRARKS